MKKLSRKDFIKASAVSAVAATALQNCKKKEGEGRSHLTKETLDNMGLNWVKAQCRYCGSGCGVLMGVDKGANKIVAAKADPDCESNKGLNCIKGYFLAKVLYGEDRLTKPLIKKNGKMVESSWDEALDLIAGKFKEVLTQHGSSAVAMFGSGQWTIFEGYTAVKFMKVGLGYVSKDKMGSNNIDPNARMCMASAVAAFMRTFGSDEPMGQYADIEHTDTVITWGANMAEMHPILYSRISAQKLKNPKFLHFDFGTQYTRTSANADYYCEFKPQSDLAILNYIANYIIQNNLYDAQFVKDNVKFKKGKTNIGYGTAEKPEDPKAGDMSDISFEQYKKFVSEYTLDKAAEISGVSKEKLQKAAEIFADKSRKVVSFWTMGFNQHTRGTWVNHLCYNIHLLTGKISKPGDGPFSLTGQPSACGTAREVGTFAHRLPADMVVMNPEHRAKSAKIWNIDESLINPKPGFHTVKMFRELEKGTVKLMWISCANPFQTMPNSSRYQKAAESKDNFIIVSDVYPSKSTEYADVILPSAFWVEKEGAYGNAERRTQHWQQAVKPMGEAMPDEMQFYEVAKRLGFADKIYPWKKETWHKELWAEYASFSSGTGKDLAPYDVLNKEHGVVWPYVDGKSVNWRYNADYDPYAKKKLEEMKAPADRKIVFYKAKKHGFKAAVLAVPYEPPGEEPDNEYPFWLNTGRVLEHWHSGSMTRRIPELHRAMPEAYCNFHPIDAKALGIQKGDKVRVSSRRGKVEITADVNGRTRPQKGMVFIAFFDETKQANHLTLDQFCPISKEPDYKKCAVKVEKI